MTLTLDWVILHSAMNHSLTSTYIPNFIEIEETFCGQTYVRTFETGIIRSSRRSRPKNGQISNFEGLVTLTLDWQCPAMDYMSTDFGADSSSHFPFKARINRHTNRQTLLNTIPHAT